MIRVSRMLVRLFPAAFREAFGAGMLQDIDRDYQQARARGRTATTWFAVATSWDLVHSAVAEHLSPTWTRPQTSLEEELDMGWNGKGWLTEVRKRSGSHVLLMVPGTRRP